MRTLTSLAGLVCLFSAVGFAQDSQTAYCDFTDGGAHEPTTGALPIGKSAAKADVLIPIDATHDNKS